MVDASTSGPTRSWTARLAWWRSPPDQPGWARPLLLLVTAVATAAYSWRMGGSTEIFYAAADRSMSSSWHDFFFAALDPAGTISIDKLPGAFWVQSLSVRAFGAHTWAVALPQAIEGALSVLVLFRVVRRCAGPLAAVIAAGVLATAPATVTLDRGNVADTLLVLLLVLAADAAVTAVHLGRPRHLLVAGLWVGLAFQAKMVEAWLVLPVLLLLYLLVGPRGVARRIGWGAALVAVAVAVSCSWMAAVSLTPRPDRPYVDGTTNDSVVSQVFDYNGIGRVDRLSPNQVLGRTLGVAFLAASPPPASATRLFEGAAGRDTGWLLPAAGLGIPALVWARLRRPRSDMVRAAVVLWGAWLLVFAVVFSVSAINGYYLGALSPPVAALAGIGASLAWTNRRARAVQGAVVAVVVLTAAYAAWLVPSSGTGVPGWLAGAVLALGVLTLGSVGVFAVTARRGLDLAMVLSAGAAMTVVPVVASVSVVTNDLGAFDTPFQPRPLTTFNKSFFGAPLQPISALPTIERVRNGAPYLLAAQTSVVAAPFIFATGQEVLPIGGYDGSTPEPTLGALRAAVARGQFHLVLSAPHSRDARILWIRAHCTAVQPSGPTPAIALAVSYCLAEAAGHGR